MKKLFLIYLSFCVYLTTNAQITTNSQWTWVSGDSTVNQFGVYGTKGLSSSSNKPGARHSCVTWLDQGGNLWLFGGYGKTSNIQGSLNDLWKFNPVTLEWTWVSGDSLRNQGGIYGMKGVSSSSNKPGARYNCVSWLDQGGNFWLFGGGGYTQVNSGSLNDLWKFNPATTEWTWVSGDSIANKFGVYGTKGVSSSTDKPGGREDHVSWTDQSGNLYLFGGYGLVNTGVWGDLNDLWRYSPSNNQWTWLSGDKLINQFGVYGAKGVASVNNKPGSRRRSSSWADQSDNLWLFGGLGKTANILGFLNDLWKFNPVTTEWTWVSGDSTVNQFGVYGTKGVSSSSNKPGARAYAASQIDQSGNLFLFGGVSVVINVGNTGQINDLWKYSPSTNQWTWISGDNIIEKTGIYGNLNLSNINNKPGARRDNNLWIDLNGRIWMFGGLGIDKNVGGLLNDLWRLGLDPLPIVLNKFSVEKQNNSVVLNWSTSSEINNKYFEVQKSIDGKGFSTIGIVEAKGVASEYMFTDEKPFIGINYYRLKQVDNDGKYSYSESKSVKFDGDGKLSFVMYPNPTKEKVNVYVNAFSGKGEIIITDISGKQIQQQVLVVGNNIIEIKKLTKGIYFVNIVTDKEKQTQKLMVE